MVLILSTINDDSTNEVIRWLRYFKCDFVRVNGNDEISFGHNSLSLDDWEVILIISNEPKKINLKNIKSYWYRRGDFNLRSHSKIKDSQEFQLENYLQREIEVIEEYLHYILKGKNHINKRSDNETNKLVNLMNAAKCGMKIPKTYLLHDGNKSQCRTEEHITKGLYSSGFYVDNYSIGSYTERVKLDEIKSSFPSCIQSEISKEFELRIFYLHGEFNSVAIFSQQCNQTSLDFRKYNKEMPNRSVPYELPNKIKAQLLKFMDLSKMNCASIDMIVTPENEYYFIEVNPIGQFQQVSLPGNFYLEKIIAEKLAYGFEN